MPEPDSGPTRVLSHTRHTPLHRRATRSGSEAPLNLRGGQRGITRIPGPGIIPKGAGRGEWKAYGSCSRIIQRAPHAGSRAVQYREPSSLGRASCAGRTVPVLSEWIPNKTENKQVCGLALRIAD
jgi:hypothetical protein